jgi:tetratricopeptide (TPR) repeat protein
MALKARDVDLADSLMRFMPTNSKTSYLKAIVNSLNGDYEAAYPYLASMGGLNEVLILLCMGRNKDADAKITAILEDQSNWKNADVWYVKAICANRLEDLNWAIEALQQAITIDPKLIEIARLDSDVMDVLDIIMPPEEEVVE